MATIFALNHLGAKFEVKLTDCTSGDAISIGDIAEQFIIFRKPDGTTFEKIAIIVEDLPNNPGEFFITYTNTDPEIQSILDLIGNWSYSGKVKLNNNDEFQASEGFIFWVS